MKRYITKDSLIVLGILAGIAVGAVVAVFVPQSRRLRALQAETVSRRAGLEADARKAAVVPGMVRRVEALKQRYNEHWEKKLPRRQDLGDFIREISNHRDAAGLSGQLIEPGTPTREELYHTLPIMLQVRGSFGALAEFLRRLDHMERLTRVQKMKIITDTKQVPAVLDIQIEMNIYFTDAGQSAS